MFQKFETIVKLRRPEGDLIPLLFYEKSPVRVFSEQTLVNRAETLQGDP